jgi:radical SAM superfamily enzyme with C-terminal helix-hairpin-helix motif
MARVRTVIDCYTDEPAGLGVPPFLGVWARYIAGRYRDMPAYCTIDDLRCAGYAEKGGVPDIDPQSGKTRKDLYNTTRDVAHTRELLRRTDQFVVIAGIQTPGKYLGAAPGTLAEVTRLLRPYKARRVLTGPAAVCGSQGRGGARAESAAAGMFDAVDDDIYDAYEDMQACMLRGAEVVSQIPWPLLAEIETGRGCVRHQGCSFCTEPLKGTPQWRSPEAIIEEVAALQRYGVTAFRLGKQSCIFSYHNGDIEALQRLLSGLYRCGPHVLHIDNANPAMVTPERTQLFVSYCTPGSTAALGVESFDPAVIERNNLNARYEDVERAVEIINDIGGFRAHNGVHHLLPGINLLLGLPGETRDSMQYNYDCLSALYDKGMLIRRLNIRKVVAYPGTPLAQDPSAARILRAHKKWYAAWTDRVRRHIDVPMLQRLFPGGTFLRDLYSTVHEGHVTFLRQMGSYPIVVGVRQRLPLGCIYDVEVTGHMRRSLEARVVDKKS